MSSELLVIPPVAPPSQQLDTPPSTQQIAGDHDVQSDDTLQSPQSLALSNSFFQDPDQPESTDVPPVDAGNPGDEPRDMAPSVDVSVTPQVTDSKQDEPSNPDSVTNTQTDANALSSSTAGDVSVTPQINDSKSSTPQVNDSKQDEQANADSAPDNRPDSDALIRATMAAFASMHQAPQQIAFIDPAVEHFDTLLKNILANPAQPSSAPGDTDSPNADTADNFLDNTRSYTYSTKLDSNETISTGIDAAQPANEWFAEGTQQGFQAVQDGTTLVVLLDSNADGISQISDVLSVYKDVVAVHVLAHGASGSIKLGNTQLNNSKLEQYKAKLAVWGKALSAGGDILLYGCDVAEGVGGLRFVDNLAQLAGVDVAASTDPTGSALLGGDWVLEYSTGEINVENPFGQDNLLNYGGLLESAVKGLEPVIFIPGFGGTGPTADSAGAEWLTTRGIAPDRLALEPLANSYDEIIQTLENVGYVLGEDLFIASWDWRVPVGPSDGTNDGIVTGVAAQIADTSTFVSGADYLGYWLSEAQDAYAASHNGASLAYVDIITHSTGGLVARTYMESDAYGINLPKVNDLVLAGVPSEGVSQTWGNLMDDWNIKPASRMLGLIVDSAWNLLQKGATITGPGGDITLSSLVPDDPDTAADESKQDFVQHYIGAARDLVATYHFVDMGADGSFAKLTDVIDLSGYENTLLQDINFDTALQQLVERDGGGKTVIVYSDDLATRGQVIERTGFTLSAQAQNEIPSFTQVIGRLPQSGEKWFEDVNIPGSGDGTVPVISAIGPFDDFTDTSGRLVFKLIDDPNGGKIEHTGLVLEPVAQAAIVNVLLDSGSVAVNQISQGLKLSDAQAVMNAITLGLLDPKELTLTVLDDIARVLDGLTGSEALNTKLPVLNQSVLDVLPFAMTFRTAISDARRELSGTTLSGNALMAEVNSVLLTYLGGTVGFNNGLFTLDFDFTKTKNKTINVNVPGGIFADAIPLDMSVTFNFDVSFGLDITSTEAGKDAGFLIINDLSAIATVDVADIPDLSVTGAGVSGSIIDGSAHLTAMIDMGFIDPNDDGKLTTTELLNGLRDLPSFVDATTSGTFDMALPLSIAAHDFDTASYGTPTVRIHDAALFDGQLPDVAVDIRIKEALRNEILTLLDSIDSKLASAAGELDTLLATDIPGIGKSVGELLGVHDLGALVDLKGAVEPYLNASYTFTGNDFPTVSGLLQAMNDAMSRAGATGINLDEPAAAGKNFAGTVAAGFDLRGFDFRGADLRGVDFSGANLGGVNFSGADLRGANLAGANLRYALFDQADLSGANLSGGFALGASFVGIKSDINTLFDTLFYDVHTAFGTVSLPGLAQLFGAGVDLSGLSAPMKASFKNFDLSGLDLTGINLGGFDLTGVNLRGTNLAGANLNGVNLTGAFAIGADFSGVTLTGATISNLLTDTRTVLGSITSNFRNLATGSLSGFNLGRFDFSGLDLTGISFSGLDLRNANFKGASGLNLTGASGLFNVDLRGVSFTGTSLSGLDLRFANLSGLDLSGFNLEGVKLSGAKLGGAITGAATNMKNALLQGVDFSGVSGIDLANFADAFFDQSTKISSSLDRGTVFSGAVEVNLPAVFIPSDAPPFSFGGGYDFATKELRFDIGVDLHPLVDLDFAFDAASAGAGGIGAALAGTGHLTAGAVIQLDAFFGIDLISGVPTDASAINNALFFGIDTLRAGAGVRVSGLDLEATLGGFTGAVNNGFGEIVVSAEIALTGGDTNDDGKIQKSEIAGVSVGLGVAGYLDMALPLSVEAGGFDTATYGTPTVRIHDRALFDGQAPDVAVDIRINDDLRKQILSILDSIDIKLQPTLAGLENLLGSEVPGLGKSIQELFGFRNATDLFRLKAIAEPYLNATYTFTGNDFPTVSGLLQAMNDAMSRAGATGINLDELAAAGKNFAGTVAAGFDLRGFDFRGADLRGVDFSGANLGGVNFSGADLRGANLAGANLRYALFEQADLRGANLSGGFALGASFVGIKSDVNTLFDNLFYDAHTEFGTVSLPGLAKLFGAGVDLSGLSAPLKASFKNFDLSGLDLTGIKLGGFDLTGVNLRGTVLAGANLNGVNLTGAFAIGAKFTNASTTGAIIINLFSDVSTELGNIASGFRSLSGDLAGFNLGRFDFSGLDLTGISFSGLDLRNANFKGASGLNLTGASGLFNVDMRGVSFTGAENLGNGAIAK